MHHSEIPDTTSCWNPLANLNLGWRVLLAVSAEAESKGRWINSVGSSLHGFPSLWQKQANSCSSSTQIPFLRRPPWHPRLRQISLIAVLPKYPEILLTVIMPSFPSWLKWISSLLDYTWLECGSCVSFAPRRYEVTGQRQIKRGKGERNKQMNMGTWCLIWTVQSTLNIHCKDWCWSWSSNPLATWCENQLHWKWSWCWEWLKAEVGVAEERMRWHHWLNGHQVEQTQGDSEGQGRLVCMVHGVTEQLDTT